MILRSQRSTLFPYTTLFRSSGSSDDYVSHHLTWGIKSNFVKIKCFWIFAILTVCVLLKVQERVGLLGVSLLICRIQYWWRSEEHTSELQSRLHLVCRLLLEK